LKSFFFELCAETPAAAQAGEAGGADRVELCAELSIGGITPEIGVTEATASALSIPVHVLIRPRGGDFVYSAGEFERMKRQIESARGAGAAGVVLGVLLPDGRVDVERSRELVRCAYPMKTTFHRAIDAAPDLSEALEAVIETGAERLLTSGGMPDVLTGGEAIGRLREQAGDRLQVMAGGGLTLANLTEVVRRSGVAHLHGSLTGAREDGGKGEAELDSAVLKANVEANVREAIRLFAAALAV
jgi:copper homeostasis protein